MILLALSLAIGLIAQSGINAASPQAESFAGQWKVVVDGTGPFAGTGSLDLAVDGATVSGTFVSGTKKIDAKGTISDGSLNLSFEGGYFLGVIRDGAFIGTHFYTLGGTTWKTGWRGNRSTSGLFGVRAEPQHVPATMMETFAARPDARTLWSKSLTELRSDSGHVRISAVILGSPTATPRTMGGLRLQLTLEGSRDCNIIFLEYAVMCDRDPATVYIDVDRLEALRTSLLTTGSAEVHAGHLRGITDHSTESGQMIILGTVFTTTRAVLADVMAAAQDAVRAAPAGTSLTGMEDRR
jgi:hypothetical protein